MANPDEKRITHTLPQLTQTKIELMNGYVRNEKRESQVLRIVSGTAWVSIDGEDMVLKPGEELKLSRGAYNAVVSATGDGPLVYEFED